MLEEKNDIQKEEKPMIAFKCDQEMADFVKKQAGGEAMSVYIRTVIREKMEAEKIADTVTV